MGSFEAEWFDENYAARTEWDRSSKQYLRALVPADKPLKILDVGCGTGLNATHLSGLGHDVRGLDISKTAIERFRSLGFEGQTGDIEAGAPYPDETFDAVFASEVLEHMVDTNKVLREWHRILKPGGEVFLSVPNSSFWVYRIYALLGRTLTEVQHPGHVRFFSVNSLKAALSEAGFDPRDISARNMYFVKPENTAAFLNPLLSLLSARKEFRVAGGYFVLHLSSFARRASSIWSDTLMVRCKKVDTA